MANKMVVVVPIFGHPFTNTLPIVIRAITTTKLKSAFLFLTVRSTGFSQQWSKHSYFHLINRTCSYSSYTRVFSSSV